jgi:hypothetical protein
MKKSDMWTTSFFNKVQLMSDTLTSIRKLLHVDEFTSFIINGMDK